MEGRLRSFKEPFRRSFEGMRGYTRWPARTTQVVEWRFVWSLEWVHSERLAGGDLASWAFSGEHLPVDELDELNDTCSGEHAKENEELGRVI